MKNTTKKYLVGVFTIVTSYILIKMIQNYEYYERMFLKFITLLTPFFLGLLIAYMLFPIVKILEKKFKMKRIFSLLIIYGVILVCSFAFFVWIFPIAINSLLYLVDDLPNASTKLEKIILNLDLNMDRDAVQMIVDKVVNALPKVSDMLVWIGNYILKTTISLTTVMVNFMLALIISIYFLANKERFLAYSKRVLYIIFKKKKGDVICDIGVTFHKNIGVYMIAKSIDSFLVGIVSYLGIKLLGSEYAVIFGILCGFTNMIPYFGPFIGMIPVFIINLFYNPTVALTTLIFLVVLQQIEGNIIEPTFVGEKLGLNPLLTLLVVTIGGGLFGIIGMILSVPVMGVIKIYLDKTLKHFSYREKLE
ncbi:AI-2E family transporter [Clostridium botulinum]|uniref:AI-2E family transporter n=1 Tax=Clostridium TaxID=1485 RepID=UPI000774C24B|nr:MULTISPECIES: AI-2E family transporter [Clostridium]MCS6130345.1 AI-2E family transporter [Clostridium botulinum]NFH78720.1 AI-2E family transporter [Clostridium botulinum]NFH83909.1 AI-2E family transporter [Clostridium botulinum]NFI10711.1 AI-2E family transporter [Clostridium botulinum]NFI13266.1 AI-2E family transporter [Clostridium botulinum]